MKKLKIARTIPRAIYYLSPLTAAKSFISVLASDFRYDEISHFEKSFAAFVGGGHAIATSHARVALFAILKTLKLNKEDEVLMSGINLPDMVNMIRLNGLVPRVFDYEEKSFNFSMLDLENKITPRTKVLFLTVLAGIDSNITDILSMARERNLIVIADQTQSMGMKIGKSALASQCDFSIYSLCDLKDIHVHRGGMIVFNDPSFNERICQTVNLISRNAQKGYFLKFIFEDFISSILLRRSFFHLFIAPFLRVLHSSGKAGLLEDLTKGKGIKIGKINLGRGLWGGDGDLVRTFVPYELLYRFTELQAKLGMKQIEKIKKIQTDRILRSQLLKSIIKKNNLMISSSSNHLFWKFPIWVSDPKKIQRRLFLRGIDCAPTNLPSVCSINAFKFVLTDKAPNAEKLISNVLYVPVHYYLSLDEVKLMGEIINEVIDE